METPNVPMRVPRTKSAELFAGSIGAKKASELEERFARELSKREIPFIFQVRLSPLFGLTERKTNQPGEVEIDFLTVWQNLYRPVQIDGEIAHYKMAWQAERDKAKDDIVNNALRSIGAWPVVRVPYWQIWTAEQTRQKVMEIFV